MSKVAIIQFPGSNTERETFIACARNNINAVEFLWNDDHNKLDQFGNKYLPIHSQGVFGLPLDLFIPKFFDNKFKEYFNVSIVSILFLLFASIFRILLLKGLIILFLIPSLMPQM